MAFSIIKFLLLTIVILLLPPIVLAKNINDDWTPTAVKYDWLQLTSLEWLKGEFKAMYNKKVEFDSDKLKLLTIKWKDVKYLQTHEISLIKIENYGSLIGLLTITDKKVIIKTGKNDEDVKEFDRNKIISFTPAGEREIDLWSIKFSLGLNIKSGNTEQIDYSSELTAKRRTASTRLTIYYIGNISKTDAVTGTLEETINKNRLTTGLDIYVTRNFFYNPLNAEIFRDPFTNIDKRISLGAGVGYAFKNTSEFEWHISAGPAYLTTKYISVQPGDDIDVDTISFTVSTDIDLEINNNLDFLYKYNIQFSKQETGGYTHYMNATLETELTKTLDLDISLIWDRISEPTLNDQGKRPEPDDFRLVLSIAFDF